MFKNPPCNVGDVGLIQDPTCAEQLLSLPTATKDSDSTERKQTNKPHKLQSHYLPSLLFAVCAALSKKLGFSELQFVHLQNEAK